MTPEDLAKRTAELDARERQLHVDRVRFDFAIALSEAKCNPAALADAAALMASVATVELGDDGRAHKVTIAGEIHANPVAAANAFLKARPHFRGADAGTGAPRGAEPTTRDAFAGVFAPQPSSPVAPASPAHAPPATPIGAPPKLPAGTGPELLEKGFTPTDLLSAGFATDPNAQ